MIIKGVFVISFFPIDLRIALPLGVISIKAIMNLCSAFYLQRRFIQHRKWLKGNFDEHVLRMSKSKTIRLLKQAGIRDKALPVAQPAGYGYLSTIQIKMFNEYPTSIATLAVEIDNSFEEAIGTYRGRALDAINPLYWIRLVVYLPTRVCEALGTNAESVPTKILQGLYWLFAAVVGTILAFAKSEFISWLNNIIG